MTAVDAWMPFYVGDYLGDTQRLSTEQHGAYLLLIMDYWRNGPAPDDDEVLRQITKLEKAAWKKHRPTLQRFFTVENDTWCHKRIDSELINATANSERRSAKAKAAAEARWGNGSSSAASNATSMPQALLEGCPPPSPSPKKEEVFVRENTSLHPALAFSGRVIRLNKSDLGQWQKRYIAIPDLMAELGALDDWLRDQPADLQKRWFHVVSGSLSKKHQKYLTDEKIRDDGDARFTGPC